MHIREAPSSLPLPPYRWGLCSLTLCPPFPVFFPFLAAVCYVTCTCASSVRISHWQNLTALHTFTFPAPAQVFEEVSCWNPGLEAVSSGRTGQVIGSALTLETDGLHGLASCSTWSVLFGRHGAHVRWTWRKQTCHLRGRSQHVALLLCLGLSLQNHKQEQDVASLASVFLDILGSLQTRIKFLVNQREAINAKNKLRMCAPFWTLHKPYQSRLGW